jgi:hypothetical protein
VDSFEALSNDSLNSLEKRSPKNNKFKKKFYLAAQSLEDPEPYSFPARMIV